MKKGNIMRDVISSSQFTENVIKEYKKGLGDMVLVAITPRTTIELPAHLTQAEIKKSLELQKFKGFFITESLVVPPGIELLKFFVSKALINSTNFYLVKIKTIELAIFLISIISIFIAVIFLTVQRYGKGSIPPNSMEINFPKTSVLLRS